MTDLVTIKIINRTGEWLWKGQLDLAGLEELLKLADRLSDEAVERLATAASTDPNTNTDYQKNATA